MKTSHLFFLVTLLGCSGANSITGGRCREGFTNVDGECTALTGPSTDSSPSYGFAGGTPVPLSSTPIDDPMAFDRDGGRTSSIASLPSSPTSPTSPSSPDGGATEIQCEAPLVACRGECIPVVSDQNNCGACGKVCPSNICTAGECEGALAGDVILLGHDYASSSSSSAQAKMIANAMTIATTDPIRVLSFAGSRTDVAAERELIASALRFRRVAYTEAGETALESPNLAKKFDVVLVHDAGLAASYLGARSRTALDTFTHKGGIVIAVDDGNSDVPAFLRDSGLLPIEGHVAIVQGTQVVITAPNDALGVQVLSPYAPSGATTGFFVDASATDVTVVARTNDDPALPTAVHRFVR